MVLDRFASNAGGRTARFPDVFGLAAVTFFEDRRFQPLVLDVANPKSLADSVQS